MANYTVINVKEFWSNKDIFMFFCDSDFKTLGYDPKGVLIDLELADRSSLMAYCTKATSRCVIGRILS